MAVFNRQGVTGSVIFSQPSPTSAVDVSVEGLASVPTPQWAVHSLPLFPLSAPDPCQSVVGPLHTNLSDYLLENVTIPNDVISLYGQTSIVGRSLVISEPSLTVCASIGPASEAIVMWAPFRANEFANGNVFLWQLQQITSIFITMTTNTLSPVSKAVLSVIRECGGAMDNDDLNWTLTVEEGGAVRQVVTASELDLGAVGGLVFGLNGSSVCAPLERFTPLHVVGGVGGQGEVVLTQQSPLHPTKVTLPAPDLQYMVHTLPPDGVDCGNTGGIFDPRGAGPQRNTLDSYPFGDISGKADGMLMYFDPYLPLSGADSVVGRALVTNGTLGGCGQLRYGGEVIELRADLVMEGFSGTITFSQSASNPLSPTTITMLTNITAEVEVETHSTIISMVTSHTEGTRLTPSPDIISSLPSLPSLPPLVVMTPSSTSLSFTASLSPSSKTSLILEPSPPPLPTSFLLPLSSTPAFFLMPDSSEPLPVVSSSPVPAGGGGGMAGRRRKREDAQFSWSLRQLDGSGSVPEDCAALPLLGTSVTTSSSVNHYVSPISLSLSLYPGPPVAALPLTLCHVLLETSPPNMDHFSLAHMQLYIMIPTSLSLVLTVVRGPL